MCNELIEQFNETIGPPLEYLTKLRWPEGFVCPIPGCDGVVGWHRIRGGRKLNICHRCRRQVSVTAHTHFSGLQKMRSWLLGGWFIVARSGCVTKTSLRQWLQLGDEKTSKATCGKMVNLYRRLMSQLAPEGLGALVDYASIGGCGFWRTYEPDPERPRGDDVTAWIKSGWPRGFPPTDGREHDIQPPIQELLFKYKHQNEPLSGRFELVIRQALGPSD